MHDEVTDRLKRRVGALYAEWKADPHAFLESYPHIRISIMSGTDPRASALRSIADYILQGNVRFYWDILETLGGEPELIITTST